MSKHTPGPWAVAVDSLGGFNRIWSAEGYDVACCTGDGSIALEERLANERLIAAAPEMLEALRGVCELLDEGFLVRNTENDSDPVWAIKILPKLQKLALIKQAIHKATGKVE